MRTIEIDEQDAEFLCFFLSVKANEEKHFLEKMSKFALGAHTEYDFSNEVREIDNMLLEAHERNLALLVRLAGIFLPEELDTDSPVV